MCLIPEFLFSTLGLELWLIRGTIFLLAALLIALCKPYKRTYMNVSDTLLLSHLALLCHIISSNTKGASIQILMQMAVLTPFAIFLLLLIIRVTSQLCKAQFQKFFLHLKPSIKSNTGTCSEQQRLNQPITIYGTMDEHGNP